MRLRSLAAAAAVVLLLSIIVFAQTPAAPKAPQHPTAGAPAKPTDLEATQLENVQLRMALLDQEEQTLPQRRAQLTERYGALIRQIEAEHPGFVWNPQVNGLVPTPPAPAKAKAEGKK